MWPHLSCSVIDPRLIAYRTSWEKHCKDLGGKPMAKQVYNALRKTVKDITATLRKHPEVQDACRTQSAQVGRQVGHHLSLGAWLRYLGIVRNVPEQYS